MIGQSEKLASKPLLIGDSKRFKTIHLNRFESIHRVHNLPDLPEQFPTSVTRNSPADQQALCMYRIPVECVLPRNHILHSALMRSFCSICMRTRTWPKKSKFSPGVDLPCVRCASFSREWRRRRRRAEQKTFLHSKSHTHGLSERASERPEIE